MIPQIVAITSLSLGIWLGLWTWGKQREFKEREFNYKLEVQKTNSEYEKLLASIKHQSDKERLEDRFSRLEDRFKDLEHKVDEVNGRGSERYGRLQGQLGTMELNLKGFISSYQAKMEELFRVVEGRRSTDKDS